MDDEFEIIGQRIDAATGAEIGVNDFRISDMGPDGSVNFGASVPALAYNGLDNQYLVVWQGDDVVDGEVEIFGQQFIGGVVAVPPPPPPPPLPLPPPPTVVTCQGRRATLVGTEGNDVLRGTARRDVIHGLGGNDKIRGLGGNDILCGGEGRDQLRGGAGKDRLHGGAGVDLCDGGPNRNQGRACEVQKNIP
ncbi:MAG: calcium-binding protein [Gammaproteobacteria bacterium]